MSKDKSSFFEDSSSPRINLNDEDEKPKGTSIFFKQHQRTASSPLRADSSEIVDDKLLNIPEINLGQTDLNFSSKLPAITELLNLRQKTIDPAINNLILNLTKYAQNMEHVVRFKNKEIQRLEYINKYLVISQQKRDEMLTHILEENRKLKEMSTRSEKKLDKRLPNIYGLTSPQNAPRKISDNSFKTTMNFNKAMDKGGLKKSATNLSKFKNELNTPRNQDHNQPASSRVMRSTGGLFDDKKSQSILKMSEEDVNNMYAENENFIFLDRILCKKEDHFIQEVKSFDETLMLQLYDSITHLKNDHRSLIEMLFKMRKILKAANQMATSLVLSESMERIVEEICDCLDCERATAFLYDHSKEELWSRAAKGSDKIIRVPIGKGIVGHVFSKGEPLNILNAYADDRFNREVDLKTGFKTNTILAVPIKDSTNRVIGVVQAINKRGNIAFFTKDDEGLLSILSSLAGIVLRNSMTYDEQVTFLNSLRASLKAGVQLCANQELKKMIPLSEKMLRHLMGVDKARVLLKHPKKELLYSYNAEEEMETFPYGCGIAGKVFETGEHQNITNAYTHQLFNGRVDIETSLPLLCVPIKYPGTEKTMGVIEVINARGIQGLSALHKAKVNAFDLETLEFFSKQLAQATYNCYTWERKMCEMNKQPYIFDQEK